MIRNKYILASDDMDYTFHFVILAGVHDIKNLKLKLRPMDENFRENWTIENIDRAVKLLLNEKIYMRLPVFVVSALSTTGYSTVSYSKWLIFSVSILIILMLIEGAIKL